MASHFSKKKKNYPATELRVKLKDNNSPQNTLTCLHESNLILNPSI
jgi:hypothetical protein